MVVIQGAVLKSCDVRHSIECLIQPSEQYVDDPLEYDIEDVFVDSRDPALVTMPEGAVAFRFYSSISVEIGVDGLEFKLQDHELDDSEKRQNVTGWFIPGGRIVSLEELPEQLIDLAKEDYDGYSFVETKAGTHLPFNPREKFKLI